MATAALLEQAKREEWSDEQVVAQVLAGDKPLYELLMRRHNQRIYRVARAILRDDAEAEDVMQDAYVRAYQNLASFEGRAKFATWLTRIAVHEALARLRKRQRFQAADISGDLSGDVMNLAVSRERNPEQQTYGREVGSLLENAVLSLSEEYRLVFTLRDIEGLSTEETARCLELTQDNVKVRLHRAHAALRKQLQRSIGDAASRCFEFHAVRCDRVVGAVFATLGI